MASVLVVGDDPNMLLFDVALCRMPGERVLECLQAAGPRLPVIMNPGGAPGRPADALDLSDHREHHPGMGRGRLQPS
jgi:hypothetical protein